VNRRVRTLIADDHAATRLGVRRALEDHEFEVVAEAADGPGAVRLARERRPDVCLLDVHMPGGGNDAAAEIVHALPDTRVVMLTVSSTDDDLFGALRAGACGYLLKETDPERLPHALRGVLNGEAALPRTLTARLIEQFRGREHRRRRLSLRGRQVDLSEREWDVLELMREGLPTKEIAERLSISPVTVRRHVQAILEKLSASTRRAALALLDA
jgi:DNA-binding NarL/FixJ family response regulator